MRNFLATPTLVPEGSGVGHQLFGEGSWEVEDGVLAQEVVSLGVEVVLAVGEQQGAGDEKE